MSQAGKQKLDYRSLLEVISFFALIISLLLVAYEVRQNTLAARAAAIQQIGIATAEMWGEFGRDPQMIRLMEKRSDIPSAEWTADDWSRFLAQMLAWSRLAETGLLQVDEGLLPASSLETLGYASTKQWLLVPEIQCIWEHRLRNMVSEKFASYVESEVDPAPTDCSGYPNFPFFDPAFLTPDVSG
ncbi:MAG: hypothetical protein AAF385_01410 [Pseudomonadota bacterium]